MQILNKKYKCFLLVKVPSESVGSTQYKYRMQLVIHMQVLTVITVCLC